MAVEGDGSHLCHSNLKKFLWEVLGKWLPRMESWGRRWWRRLRGDPGTPWIELSSRFLNPLWDQVPRQMLTRRDSCGLWAKEKSHQQYGFVQLPKTTLSSAIFQNIGGKMGSPMNGVMIKG